MVLPSLVTHSLNLIETDTPRRQTRSRTFTQVTSLALLTVASLGEKVEMTKIIQKVRQIHGDKAVQGLWDLKNNQLPTRCAIKSAVCSVHMALHARGILNPLQLHSVGDSKIPETIKGRRELDFFVDSFISASSVPQATEQRVKFMMRSWSRKHAAGDYLALLASKEGYEEEAILLEERGQHLLLFGTEGTPATLRKHSYIFWVWERLLQAHEMDASYMKDIMGTTKEERGDC